MEEENQCTPSPDDVESVLQQPYQDSSTTSDHKCISGGQETIMGDETEMQIHQTQEADQVCLFSTTECMISEEAEQWEQSVWEMRPVSCSSPPFSFAMVEWDTPGPSAETSQLTTDSRSANELHSGGVTTPGSTSPSLLQPQDINSELFKQGDREEPDEFDSWLFLSGTEWSGGDSEVCEDHKKKCGIVLSFFH